MPAELTLTLRSRDAWRAWLAEHHGDDLRVWLVFWKPIAGETGVPYGEALDEALCFGWIDSLIKKLDEERYARLFTPRRDVTKWSKVNLARVRVLLAEGRMHEAGKAKLGVPLPAEGEATREEPRPEALPAELEATLKRRAAAWKAWEKLPPSHRREYVKWIVGAKKSETRERRLAEAIEKLVKGEKLGLK